MGGGLDSRIPSLLDGYFSDKGVDVVVRTYSFDPDKAWEQLTAWADELKPDMVIGESLGANYAVALCPQRPHLYVSPAMNAPKFIVRYAWVAHIPGMTSLLNRFFRPTRPLRQEMDFRPSVMKRYGKVYERACAASRRRLDGDNATSFAFFGNRDHYVKWGVVDMKKWDDRFGSYCIYPGSHFMENEFVYSLLIPKIESVLSL